MHRRTVLAAAGAMAAQQAAAQETWPSRPLRLVVPYPPGGPTDILARVVAAQLAGQLGQPAVIENRPGASGAIGAAEVARAAPDGTTFLVNASIHTILPHLSRTAPYDALADFAPVTNIASVPLILVVSPGLPVRSVPDLIAHLRAHPGRLSFASSGTAAAPHLAGELFKRMTGTEMTHVPYRGSGPALQDVVGGRVEMMFDSMPSSAALVRGGQLRALAVSTKRRVAAFPDLPTVAEAGVPGYAIATWYGVWAPARTPAPILARLQGAVSAILEQPETRARLDTLGAEPVADSPEAFGRFVRSEYERWGRLVQEARITAD
ncbi:tripartite tricarboxylate transporter substrate binding protein [Roseomonas sp. SSH11]|uniref:Tripartite tricarboxylate transporter substrate binding protein n=1 Tax=Pararoseomonas baculiformis TaxID=2820812 RepID=A0ABS4ALH1_9PROT|nr:tripartite tricarboxylate transporter substrate binding protein [Pararoseomonas baculiformis]MBP0447868.1 tripartite tricarboxylate transporter substrate binding protein [Pararoseomonas baculiformis]